MEIENASDTVGAFNLATSSTSTFNTASSIVNELVDREQSKKNVIIFNLQEAVNHQMVIDTFQNLCKTVYKTNIIAKTLWLGKQTTNQHRPLLLCMSGT